MLKPGMNFLITLKCFIIDSEGIHISIISILKNLKKKKLPDWLYTKSGQGHYHGETESLAGIPGTGRKTDPAADESIKDIAASLGISYWIG